MEDSRAVVVMIANRETGQMSFMITPLRFGLLRSSVVGREPDFDAHPGFEVKSSICPIFMTGICPIDN